MPLNSHKIRHNRNHLPMTLHRTLRSFQYSTSSTAIITTSPTSTSTINTWTPTTINPKRPRQLHTSTSTRILSPHRINNLRVVLAASRIVGHAQSRRNAGVETSWMRSADSGARRHRGCGHSIGIRLRRCIAGSGLHSGFGSSYGLLRLRSGWLSGGGGKEEERGLGFDEQIAWFGDWIGS